jgi:triosephosphate isomerase
MTKLIAANWKENPRTEAKALKLFMAVAKAKRDANVEVAIFPPFIYLEELARSFKRLSSRTGLSLGAQDVFWEEQGAYTSEVGPAMLRGLGLKYVILGHSETRKYEKETDAMINKKLALAAQDGMKIILCVGESLSVRKKGATAAKRFVEGQLKKDLKKVFLKKGTLHVAYEPIWAIGTGKSDSPEDARDMAIFIKASLKKAGYPASKVLYGGSVNSKNAPSYVQLKEIDGALIGGASLKAEKFLKIINTI